MGRGGIGLAKLSGLTPTERVRVLAKLVEQITSRKPAPEELEAELKIPLRPRNAKTQPARSGLRAGNSKPTEPWSRGEALRPLVTPFAEQPGCMAG